MAEIELPRLVQKLYLDASGVKKGAAEAEAAFNKATLAVGQTGAAAAGLGQSYNKASAAADEASKKTLAAWNKASDGMADVGKKLSTFVTLPLLGIGAAGLKVAGEFDTTMRTMAAVAGVPAPELKQLSSLALQMGKDTVFSANDAAGAMLNLAKAGISTADIMGGGLKATLDLAAAGGLDLGNAATIAANAMHTFGLSGKDAASIADALAGAANASSADVSDLALALSQGGLAAHAAHLSLQETTATLAAFADAGIRGSDAGTSLKTFLLNLVPNTKPARAAMADLGLKFTDLRGAMLPIGDIAEQLKVKTANLSDEQKILALQTIFGTDAYRAALVISEQGAAGLDKYRAATSKVGTAAEVAAARMAGWKGTWEQFRGSVETAALSIGNIVIPAITPLVNKVKELADSFTDLDPKQAAFLVTLGGVAAAAGPALLVVGKLGTSVGALSETLGAAPLAITGWGLAILAIGVALAGAWDKSELLRNAVGKLMNAGEDLSSVVRNLVTDFAPLGAALASIATATVIAGLSAIAAILSTLTGFLADHPALVGTLAAAYLVTLVPAIYTAVTAFAALKLEQVAVGFYNLVEAVEKGIVALGGLAAAATTALALTGLGLALYKLSTTMGDTVDAGKKLVSVLKEQTTLDSAHAWEAYGKALAGAKGELGKIHLSSKAVNEELAKTKNVASNIATVQATAHLSAEAIYDLAQKLKIDLTQGGDKAKEGTAKLVAEFESLTREAYGSSDATRFVSTDFKKLEEDAKATAEAVKKVSEAFQKDVDAISGYSKFLQDATKNSDAYSSAQERLKGAQDALAALRERQAGDDKITISDQQQLAKATDDVAKAQQGVADAAAQVKGTSLATFYEEQLSKAQAFADGVQDAAARGLDPNLIMRLLQAGPDAAAPFLQGLAQDHSTRIIEIVNKAEEALALINSKVIANSRIVQQALNDDKSDQKVRDIGLAMEVSAASFDAAGNITRQAIADKIKKPLDDVNRVVDEFGIKVTNMPDINVQSNAKSVTDDLKDAQRAAQELDGTTATVTVFHDPDTVYHDDLSHASAMGNVLGQFGIVPMARGGTRTPGFVTHGPSFLVGEGKVSRPEYVVPTDPAFHDRAVKLWGGLTSELFPHSGIGNDGAMSPSWGSLGAGISQAPQSPVTMGPARAMAQPESIDYERLGAETAKALRGNVNFRLDINGRVFAEATADDMSKAQGDNRKGRTRS